jgi:DNA (cytosine-5)-methyltransferase 1
VAGLFAGIGGIERGLHTAGHETRLLCENEPAAARVLSERFADIPLHDDVTTLAKLPARVTLLAAGFPCQDLSQAGKTAGIGGHRSGLVAEVFRLVKAHRTPWLLLENVPFMLQLGRGRAMEVIVAELEAMGYRWAYRVVDARSFGLPQRRRRVYLVASLQGDPRTVLFADEAGVDAADDERALTRGVACGFYWTEGIRGLGWAADAVPTLKGGSTIGIPSPPAILLPNGEVVTPDIRDAERMQGFPTDWTKPAEEVAKRGARWKLVGNAVSVPAAAWIGKRMAKPGPVLDFPVRRLVGHRTWPVAAWNVGAGRFEVMASEWPVRKPYKSLAEFLKHPGQPLSPKATAGFLSRTERATLRFPEGFLEAIAAHLERVSGGTSGRTSLRGGAAPARPIAV